MLKRLSVNFNTLPHTHYPSNTVPFKTRPFVHFSGFSPDFSYSGFTLVLVRKSRPYILNYYLPSMLFVVVSWVRELIRESSQVKM